MSAAYFQAAVPEPFRILGLSLRPMSIGRYRLMQRFNVAFVADGPAKAGIADLLLGILICSMRCDEFKAWANSPSFARDVRRWSRQINPAPFVGRLPWVGRLWRDRHAFNVYEKIALFKRYLKTSYKTPLYWDLTQNDRVSGAHWSQSIEITLRSKVGWSKEEIDEEPLSKALMDFYKFAENEGAIQLMSDQEIELLKASGLSVEGGSNGA